ncbi:MAG: hypothetical protein AcusKO_26490 [Acuticoccus sp.]
MSNSPNLGLPYLQGSQAQKHVTVNDALRRLDAVVQLQVADRTRNVPPGSPQEGDRHIVAASPSGAWAGHAFEVAVYEDGFWVFFEPREGWFAFSVAEDAIVYFNGTSWEIFVAAGAAEATAKLGINGTADSSKRLFVQSDFAVFSHDGTKAVPTGDTQVILNKNAAGDTGSMLFQRGFSGRAEIGLVGSDDLSMKVSSNGSSWKDAFVVDGASGQVDFATVPAIAGTDGLAVSYKSRVEAEAAAIPVEVRQIEVRGYWNENDGGGARYFRVASLPADGLGFEDAGGGFWRLIGKDVTSRQAGAVGNGSADDTAALRRAFESGRNVRLEAGDYYITNVLRVETIYQRVIGDGRGKTCIIVDENFNMSAAGIIKLDQRFTTLQDFTIQFDQSGVSTRGQLRQYPPAVHMVDQSRVRLTALRFEGAFEGVRATGNTGGAIFEDIECGSFDTGFRFGGALDSVEMSNCRTWPYGFAGDSTLLDIYSDGNNTGFRIGQVDDLKMTNITPFRTKMIFEGTLNEDNVLEVPFGTIQGLALDGFNSKIIFNAGEITISSLYATTNIANDTFITQNGGFLAISDFNFEGGTLSNVPMVHVADSGATCMAQNGRVLFASTPNGEGFRVSAGRLSVSSVRFQVSSGTSRTQPLIRQTGGQLAAYGNIVNGPSGGTSGAFIGVQTNDDHVIMGNHSSGWDIDLPGQRSNGIYALNHDGSGIVP